MCLKISLGWEIYIFCVLKMIAVISKLLFIFLLHTHTQKYTNSAFSSRMVFSLPQSFFRSSHQRCSVRKVFLEISQNSQENTCASARPETLLKKRLSHRCFHVNFVKFLRTLFLQNTSGGCFWRKTVAKKKPFVHLFHRTPLGSCFFFFKNLFLIKPTQRGSPSDS